jgi:hypothetical protein
MLQQRIPKDEVQNDTDGVGYEDRKQGPKQRPHPPSARIPNDIANEKCVDGDHHHYRKSSERGERNPGEAAMALVQPNDDEKAERREWDDRCRNYRDDPRRTWNDIHFFAEPAHNALPVSLRFPSSNAVAAAVIEATANEIKNHGPALTRLVPSTSSFPPDSPRTSSQEAMLANQENIPSPHSVRPFQRIAAAASRSRNILA